MISIDFDPALTSFSDILAHFWQSHHSLRNHPSAQYRHVLFYRSPEQLEVAERSFDEEANRNQVTREAIKTHLEPVTEFTYAEGYHQAYYLTRYREIRTFLEETYPDEKSLGDSAVATRLNAFLGSGMERDWETFLTELPSYGLPASLEATLAEAAEGH